MGKAKANSTQAIKAQTAGREEFQSTAQRYDKRFQDLVEEVNTKTRIGYKKNKDSDRSNKLKVLYQPTAHLKKEEILKQFQRQNKLVPYQANFVEEHLEETRKNKASLDYQWLAYTSKGTQPEMNAEQSNTTQAVKNSESKTTTQRTTQLLKQCKIKQHQAAKSLRMFRKHLQQIKGVRKGWGNSISN